MKKIRPNRRPVEQVALVGDVYTESQRLFTRAEAKEDLMWLQDLCKLTAKLLTRGQDKEAKRLSEKLDEYKTEHNILSMLQFTFDAGQNRRNDGALGGSQVDLFRNDGTSRYGRPYITATPPKQRVIFTGMSRCAYHLGRYDKALAAGKATLEMNRHFPFVHKYIALSQKAMGDFEAAKATIARALVYKAP